MEDAFVRIANEENAAGGEGNDNLRFENLENVPKAVYKNSQYSFSTQFSGALYKKTKLTFKSLQIMVILSFSIGILIVMGILAKEINKDDDDKSKAGALMFYGIFYMYAMFLISSIYSGIPCLEKELQLKFSEN